MGKIRTTSDAMNHIAKVVKGTSKDITEDVQKLRDYIWDLEQNAQNSIKQGKDEVSSLEYQIARMESQIYDLSSLSSDDSTQHQSDIEELESEIEAAQSKIQYEERRISGVEKVLNQLKRYEIQILSSLKQMSIAVSNADVNGSQFIKKKADIVSQKYNQPHTILGIGEASSFFSSNETEEYSANADNQNADWMLAENGGNSGSVLNLDSNGDTTAEILNFKSDWQNADRWASENFQEWHDSLSVLERQSIIDYKMELYPHESSYYVNINRAQRGYEDFRNGNDIRAERIGNALNRASMPTDVIAYRGVDQDALNIIMTHGHDDAFMSCSLNSNNEFTQSSPGILILTIPEGTQAAFIGNVGENEYQTECEILVNSGSDIVVYDSYETERSEITGDESHTDTVTVVEAVVER